jgi:hypothetical protein
MTSGPAALRIVMVMTWRVGGVLGGDATWRYR